MSERDLMVREMVSFRGVVQGVGFRASCRAVAGELSLVGWVRNEADGTVTAHVQGPSSAVEQFYERVSGAGLARIEGVCRSAVPTDESELEFVVAR